jgi:hypothetical protein
MMALGGLPMVKIEDPLKRGPRRSVTLPAFAALFGLLTTALLGLIAQGLFFEQPPFVVDGWLVDQWNQLGESRGTIISQLIFVLGAAWAAILAPLVFRGELTSLKDAQQAAINELQSVNASAMSAMEESIGETVEELQKAAEQARNSLSAIQSFALQNVGFKSEYNFDDLARARSILIEMQSVAIALCQSVVQSADANIPQDAFGRMWPLYRPYILKMRELGLIDDNDRDRFMAIADSRRYTREQNPEPITVAELNALNAMLRALREKFERTFAK